MNLQEAGDLESGRTDRRVRYTKMVLKQSLLELMKTRPINKITVTEICELADVNRGTFYTHYTDPYDLLNQIENELFEKIHESLGRKLNFSDVSDLLVDIFEAIQENRDLCAVLFSDFGDKDFLKRIVYIAKESSIKEWKKQAPDVDESTLDMLYIFTANGSVGVIESWIKDGMKENVRQLAELINLVSYMGMQAFLYGQD